MTQPKLIESLRAFGEMPLEGDSVDPLIAVMNSLAHQAADEIERLQRVIDSPQQAVLMAHIKVRILGEGQHPSEVLLMIRTACGVEENVIVDRRSVDNGTIDVGYPVGCDGDRYLVELLRETANGQWRLLDETG